MKVMAGHYWWLQWFLVGVAVMILMLGGSRPHDGRFRGGLSGCWFAMSLTGKGALEVVLAQGAVHRSTGLVVSRRVQWRRKRKRRLKGCGVTRMQFYQCCFLFIWLYKLLNEQSIFQALSVTTHMWDVMVF